MKKQLSFRAWIEKEGIDTLAKLFKVDKATIYNWRAGRSTPVASQMKAIKRYSRGEIDYVHIIERRTSTGKGQN